MLPDSVARRLRAPHRPSQVFRVRTCPRTADGSIARDQIVSGCSAARESNRPPRRIFAPRGSILLEVRGVFPRRTLGAAKRSRKCAKPAKHHHQDTIFSVPHKGSFVLIGAFHYQVSCQTKDEVIGEGCAAMVPWQEARAPISAVLAAKRLDHLLYPFSSLR